MNEEGLQEYTQAWNAHDIDTIMSFHTEDTIFETGGGKEKYGTRFEGIEVVRQRFIEVWTELPDAYFEGAEHFASGDRGCSQWTFHGTRADGSRIEVDGCDLFTFEAGKIKLKNSLLKNRAN
jgi:ketosteroid isomerase-like protein